MTATAANVAQAGESKEKEAKEFKLFNYSEYESLPDTLKGIHRMISVGNNRMRPIAMTTFAAIFALMPFAMNIGAGSEMLQALAIAIVSGTCRPDTAGTDCIAGVFTVVQADKGIVKPD